MREHRYVSVDNLGKHSDEVKTIRLLPLKIYISAQNGRQNLLAFSEKVGRLNSYRLDDMSNVRIEEASSEKFEALRAVLSKAEAHMWGVNCKRNIEHTEHVEFELRIKEDEEFMVRRLVREKRCGCVEKIDDSHYRYTADVFDTNEMLPWIKVLEPQSFVNLIKERLISQKSCDLI